MTLNDMHKQVIASERILQEKDREIADLKRKVRNLEFCVKAMRQPFFKRIFHFGRGRKELI